VLRDFPPAASGLFVAPRSLMTEVEVLGVWHPEPFRADLSETLMREAPGLPQVMQALGSYQ
jgi:hypothetical protein